jgi:hypothetical protein
MIRAVSPRLRATSEQRQFLCWMCRLERAQGFAEHFPPEGSHLERYASRFSGVEINSSFYRPHRPQPMQSGRRPSPRIFAFRSKFPKVITHEKRLVDAREPLQRFLDEVAVLDSKLGPLWCNCRRASLTKKASQPIFLADCATFSKVKLFVSHAISHGVHPTPIIC